MSRPVENAQPVRCESGTPPSPGRRQEGTRGGDCTSAEDPCLQHPRSGAESEIPGHFAGGWGEVQDGKKSQPRNSRVTAGLREAEADPIGYNRVPKV